MNNNVFEFGSTAWAEQHFGKVQLFDQRRTKRLVAISSRLAENKGQSLARLFDKWYDVKATYNLIKLPYMTPDVIQSNHREVVIQNIIDFEGDVLAIED